MARVCSWLLAVLLIAGAVAAQEVTIDVRDAPLTEVLELLTQQTAIGVSADKRAAPTAPPVTLKVEQAPLKQVVREICRQIGWHVSQSTPYYLIPGPEKDDRPRCTVGEYEITVDYLRGTKRTRLPLGPADRATRPDDRLSLSLTIGGRTEQDMIAVRGLAPSGARAVTNTGATMELRVQGIMVEPDPGRQEERRAGYFAQALPPDEATSFVSLEGELLVYSKLEQVDFEFAGDEIGVTKQAGAAQLTYTKVDTSREQFTVLEFDLRLPPEEAPAGKTERALPEPDAWIIATRTDGVRYRDWGLTGALRAKDGQRHFHQMFACWGREGGEPPQIKSLSYRAFIPREPLVSLPFKLENIPLPTWREEE